MEKLHWLKKIDVSTSSSEMITCAVLVSISVIGNTLLIFSTWKCITEHLRTTVSLIFSLASVHLMLNLLVNVLKIVYASGVEIDSAGCKFLTFETRLTTSLAIWFTLYIAWLYCFKISQVLFPLVESGCPNRWKCHIILICALWVADFAACTPLLQYAGQTEKVYIENESYQLLSSLSHIACKTEYGNNQIEFYYGKIFFLLIDVIPLFIMLLVGFRILHLLCEHKKATYGGIWIGGGANEKEVLRACKIVLLLIGLVILLWVTYFSLMYCQPNFSSYYFAPPILSVLSSAYSAISPYCLILINYKVKVTVKCFCCHIEKKPITMSSVSASVLVSPYS